MKSVAPKRKITNTGTKKVIGKFPSLKMSTTIWWESQLERDYIYLLEIDPDVLSYCEQPFTMTYPSQGKLKRYTPDFLVTRSQSQQIVEVKPERLAHAEKNLQLWRQIAPIAIANNREFFVVTEKMIRVQPRLNNIKLLYKYAKVPLSFNNYLDCLEYFQNNKSLSLINAEQHLRALGISRSLLLRLLWSGVLVTDLMTPINSESLIQLCKGNCNWERLLVP
jgi:TnsA endonuclease N terminal